MQRRQGVNNMWLGRRIGVLMGGLSSERDVSIASGEAVAAALAERGHDVVKIFVDHDLDLVLRAERVEVAFIALHGRFGEDGCVQGLCEMLGIPYTGSAVLASALAMDKLKTKELLRQHNLATPAHYVHRRGQGRAVEQHGSFGYPAVVKPRAEGSSLGVSRVLDEEELEPAIELALAFDDHVLVERFIEGVEMHVAVLAGQALGAIEIDAHGIYDYPARRGHGQVTLVTPPRLSPERLRGVLTVAERAAAALETDGLVEVDLVLSSRGNEFVLEVDTLPQLSPQGLVARVAAAAGIGFGQLVDEVLDSATLHVGGAAGRSRHRRQQERERVVPTLRVQHPEHH